MLPLSKHQYWKEVHQASFSSKDRNKYPITQCVLGTVFRWRHNNRHQKQRYCSLWDQFDHAIGSFAFCHTASGKENIVLTTEFRQSRFPASDSKFIAWHPAYSIFYLHWLLDTSRLGFLLAYCMADDADRVSHLPTQLKLQRRPSNTSNEVYAWAVRARSS